MKGIVKNLEANPSMHECTVSIDFGNPLGILKCYSIVEEEIEENYPSKIKIYTEDDHAQTILLASLMILGLELAL